MKSSLSRQIEQHCVTNFKPCQGFKTVGNLILANLCKILSKIAWILAHDSIKKSRTSTSTRFFDQDKNKNKTFVEGKKKNFSSHPQSKYYGFMHGACWLPALHRCRFVQNFSSSMVQQLSEIIVPILQSIDKSPFLIEDRLRIISNIFIRITTGHFFNITLQSLSISQDFLRFTWIFLKKANNDCPGNGIDSRNLITKSYHLWQ